MAVMSDKEMFMSEEGASPDDDSGMKAAKELDKVEIEMTISAVPDVTVRAGTVKAIVSAINKAMPLFEAPPLEVEAVDLKKEPMPYEVVQALQMVNAAYEDYEGEPLVSVEAMVDDKSALIELSKMTKALADRGFVKFLKEPAPETKGTEMAEEVMEEEEEEMSDDDMMKRMS
jgi:hypothetical protein